MRGRGVNLMQLLTVAEAMQPLPVALPPETPLNAMVALLAEASTDGLPVIDAGGHYHGVVGSEQIEQAMRDSAFDATARDLAQDLPALATGQPLERALGALVRARSGLPVRTVGDATPIGWLTHTDVLRAYNRRLEQGIRQPPQERGETKRPETPGQVGLGRARLSSYRIVNLDLAGDRPPVGQHLDELNWPANTTVLAVRRADRILQADEHLRIEQGDRLTLLTPADAIDGRVDPSEPEQPGGHTIDASRQR